MWESPHTVDCIPSRAGVCLASNRRSPAESREDINSCCKMRDAANRSVATVSTRSLRSVSLFSAAVGCVLQSSLFQLRAPSCSCLRRQLSVSDGLHNLQQRPRCEARPCYRACLEYLNFRALCNLHRMLWKQRWLPAGLATVWHSPSHTQ
jgi:hypothetical protein